MFLSSFVLSAAIDVGGLDDTNGNANLIIDFCDEIVSLSVIRSRHRDSGWFAFWWFQEGKERKSQKGVDENLKERRDQEERRETQKRTVCELKDELEVHWRRRDVGTDNRRKETTDLMVKGCKKCRS